jgi:hypothetical protein
MVSQKPSGWLSKICDHFEKIGYKISYVETYALVETTKGTLMVSVKEEENMERISLYDKDIRIFTLIVCPNSPVDTVVDLFAYILRDSGYL